MATNLSVALDPTPFPSPRILPAPQPFHPPPILGEQRRRGLHPQSLMRSLPVVLLHPARAALLLPPARALGLARHFGLVNPMHLLVRAVLAWPSWRDELHLNAQLH